MSRNGGVVVVIEAVAVVVGVVDVVGARRRRARHVDTGAEGAADAGDDDDAHVRVVVGDAHVLEHLEDGAVGTADAVEGVHPVRTVELDPGDARLHLWLIKKVVDQFGHHRHFVGSLRTADRRDQRDVRAQFCSYFTIAGEVSIPWLLCDNATAVTTGREADFTNPPPLEGVKVIDLTHYIAGPYCTKLLADRGADVLKIERPDGGDPARRIGPFFHDEPHLEGSGLFLHLNTNKRSMTLNLKSPQPARRIFSTSYGCRHPGRELLAPRDALPWPRLRDAGGDQPEARHDLNLELRPDRPLPRLQGERDHALRHGRHDALDRHPGPRADQARHDGRAVLLRHGRRPRNDGRLPGRDLPRHRPAPRPLPVRVHDRQPGPRPDDDQHLQLHRRYAASAPRGGSEPLAHACPPGRLRPVLQPPAHLAASLRDDWPAGAQGRPRSSRWQATTEAKEKVVGPHARMALQHEEAGGDGKGAGRGHLLHRPQYDRGGL